MKLAKTKRRQTVAIGLAVATVSVLGATIFNGAAYIQDRGDVNLGMPAQFPTKAQLWVQEHEADPPGPNKVARNMQIVKEGLIFYRANEARFPAEAKMKILELQNTPVKITHVLSFAEEQRIFRAAQEIMSIMKNMAGPPRVAEPTPAAK